MAAFKPSAPLPARSDSDPNQAALVQAEAQAGELEMNLELDGIVTPEEASTLPQLWSLIRQSYTGPHPRGSQTLPCDLVESRGIQGHGRLIL